MEQIAFASSNLKLALNSLRVLPSISKTSSLSEYSTYQGVCAN